MSLSVTERQKLLLQQEIDALSGTFGFFVYRGQSSSSWEGAISRHAKPTAQPTFHPYARGRPTRGITPFRARGRGRGGRGGSYSLDLRSINKQASSSSGASTPITPSQAPNIRDKEAGELSPPPQGIKSVPEREENTWVKKTSKGGNMSLMTVKKRLAPSPVTTV
jgi:hypothetical protein